MAHDTCDLYAQHVWQNGVLDTLAWPEGNWISRPPFERENINYPLVTYPGDQGGPQPDMNGGWRMAEDGVGGAFTVWHDSRFGHFLIYGQHLAGTGIPAWTEGGIPIAGTAADPATQKYPGVITDGVGGIYVCWQEQGELVATWQIRASHVLWDGTVEWSVWLHPTAFDQTLPFIVSDGDGGAWVAWETETATPSGRDIGAAHVDIDGNVTAVDIPLPNDQRFQKPASDGYGGLFIAMGSDLPTDTGNIHVARIRRNGTFAWESAICLETGMQTTPCIIASQPGQAIISWIDYRDPTTIADVYAMKVDTSSICMWPAWPDGRPICIEDDHQGIAAFNNPWMTTDAAGGAVIIWGDQRDAPAGFLYGQRVDADGNILWPTNGVPLSNDLSGGTFYGSVTSDDNGGAWATWCDNRDGLPDGGCNIYTQRVYADGSTAPPADACAYRGTWHPQVFDPHEVSEVWDMVKVDWCLCQSPDLPNPPYIWCPDDIAGNIVAALTMANGMSGYALICNCMEDDGIPFQPGFVYYTGLLPLEHVVAVAVDDRGPTVWEKSFWWGSNPGQLLLQTDLWGNPLSGPFDPASLGIPDFQVTGLAIDGENHHLWAMCESLGTVFYEFDISNPANPWLLQGPIPVPWHEGDVFGGGGLEYNDALHRLMAVNAPGKTAECFIDLEPEYSGGLPGPGVDQLNYCLLFESQNPYGLAVKDGKGPGLRGVLEIIDHTALDAFPLMGYEPPCTFPQIQELVLTIERLEEFEQGYRLSWNALPGVDHYNIYQAGEPYPQLWMYLDSTTATTYTLSTPVARAFFRVTAVYLRE